LVLLAAGSSSRLGRAKQLLQHHGESLVRRAARMALATAPRDAVVVLGAQAEAVFAQVQDLPLRRVDCSNWQAGMSASLRAGVAALSTACRGVLVVLCDQPALDAAHLQRLCALWQARPETGVASHYAGHAAVPAVLPRTWCADLDRLDQDRGARDLLRLRQDRLQWVENEALAHDIDHPTDLSLLT
jgi:CTP:molybdopterin cytidylyltransferase MocA